MYRERVKSYVDRVFEGIWRSCFRQLRGLSPKPVRCWESAGGQRIVVVAPHPDDEVAGCAGTLLRHRAAGDDITVLFVTDGRLSRRYDLSPEVTASRRRTEAEAAAQALGAVNSQWWGFAEGEWSIEIFRRRAMQAFGTYRPDIVYAPSVVDFHPEHRKVAIALAGCIPAGIPVRMYPVQVPLTSVVANLISDVSKMVPEIVALMHIYLSQYSSLERILRMRRYAAVVYSTGNYIEEFWELEGETFARIHEAKVANLAFRGLRARALTDPLAYLIGNRARRTLRALSEG